jgi:hypothetical protein
MRAPWQRLLSMSVRSSDSQPQPLYPSRRDTLSWATDPGSGQFRPCCCGPTELLDLLVVPGASEAGRVSERESVGVARWLTVRKVKWSGAWRSGAAQTVG